MNKCHQHGKDNKMKVSTAPRYFIKYKLSSGKWITSPKPLPVYLHRKGGAAIVDKLGFWRKIGGRIQLGAKA